MYGETILEWEATDTIRSAPKDYNLTVYCVSLNRTIRHTDWIAYGDCWKIKRTTDSTFGHCCKCRIHCMSNWHRKFLLQHTKVHKSQVKNTVAFRIIQEKKKLETTTSTMLYTLDKDVVERQGKQARELDVFTDSLVIRNNVLNHQLEEIISQMNATIQQDLLGRE